MSRSSADLATSRGAKQFASLAITIPEEVPDHNLYPPEAVQVRNTFIHVASPIAPDDVLSSRPAVSCPASQIGTLHKSFQGFHDTTKTTTPELEKLRPVICLEDALFDQREAYDAWQCPIEPFEPFEPFEAFEPRLPTIPAPFEPAPGSAELPSIGSRGHYSGECKPCSFLYAKGCNNGAMCMFCHLCDRSEKKRRQKAKRAALKGGA
ncbi:unnamed protein product [Effrenium voratum]|nr:unnamed protein product [Effrenium voratum]